MDCIPRFSGFPISVRYSTLHRANPGQTRSHWIDAFFSVYLFFSCLGMVIEGIRQWWYEKEDVEGMILDVP